MSINQRLAIQHGAERGLFILGGLISVQRDLQVVEFGWVTFIWVISFISRVIVEGGRVILDKPMGFPMLWVCDCQDIIGIFILCVNWEDLKSHHTPPILKIYVHIRMHLE